MNRALPRSAWLAAGLLLLAPAAFAAQVYQWKDAQGVTHYTDQPPANQTHTTRQTAAPKPTPAAAPAVNANCTNARGNLETLQGKADVGVDEDGDGKPDRMLSDAERAARVKLAETQIDTYCGAALDARG